MDPTTDQVNTLLGPFIDKGILGVLCAIFMYTTFYMWRWGVTQAKERDILIAQLYEKRIEEKDAIADIARSNERTLDQLARSLNLRVPT